MVLTPWRIVSRLTPAYRDLQENALIVSILFKEALYQISTLLYFILFFLGGGGSIKYVTSICEKKCKTMLGMNYLSSYLGRASWWSREWCLDPEAKEKFRENNYLPERNSIDLQCEKHPTV